MDSWIVFHTIQIEQIWCILIYFKQMETSQKKVFTIIIWPLIWRCKVVHGYFYRQKNGELAREKERLV